MNTVYIISGPAGVGKSTTSKKLVKNLTRSSYISGDTVSHIPVMGRGKPWLDKDTNDLTWKNIRSITENLLDYEYDVVIDYVTFPREAHWLKEQLMNRQNIKIVYVVLLVDQDTIQYRDQLRQPEVRMGERSLILLSEFENDTELAESNKLYTQSYSVEQLDEIIATILEDDKFILR
ncbi:hypothetical protein E0485_05420 [Paenibacillus albiflavus]|uniref:AAA family ATPase n=1 Tax=Paenibacillus albiflavus TaxID=2545760 RepID=A0A4R4ELS8_9BACL|nr:AAA family ATPase [Paenibacillus albiflavus]TCZ79305.1 hypothetical protein E0485_05420 [Paenibacillus albiflavus]